MKSMVQQRHRMSIGISLSNLLIIDGPNIDAVLGLSVLQRKPLPSERPRWDRVLDVARLWYSVFDAEFILNGDKFDDQRSPFYRFLKQTGYNVVTPKAAEWCDSDRQDPVDEYAKHRIESLIEPIRTDKSRGVLLVSHDGGYAAVLDGILALDGFVGIVAFREWLAPELVALKHRGAMLLDLQRDFGAFDVRFERPDIAS